MVLAASTSRETDCYSWHDSVGRHTLVDAAHSRAKPYALGSLSPETNLPVHLRLIVLCADESLPGADGLLCGQRSYRTIGPHHVRPLLFQNYINARRQFPRHRHDGFARRYFLRMTVINALVESAQLRIFLNGGPGALNQLISQPAVAGARNLAAIFFLAGRMLARDDAEEAGNLPSVCDLLWVAEPGHQMRSYDPADARQALQQVDRLLQFRIIQAVATNLFDRRGRCLKVKMQGIQQIIKLEAHRLRARQCLQLAHRRRRPLLLGIGKRNPFVEQQRLDAQLAGRQLPHVRVPQLHQVAQVAIGTRRHVNAMQLSASQTFRKLPPIESIGHALFINIKPRKDIVLAGNKLGTWNLNRHRRSSWNRLTSAYPSDRPDIQHTCLQNYSNFASRFSINAACASLKSGVCMHNAWATASASRPESKPM